MVRRSAEIIQLVSLARGLVDLGNNALLTRRNREVKELETRHQAFLEALQQLWELVESYLDKTFTECRFTLESLFQELNQSVASRDYDALSTLVAGIIAVMEQNPLHNFENFKVALQDPKFIIEL